MMALHLLRLLRLLQLLHLLRALARRVRIDMDCALARTTGCAPARAIACVIAAMTVACAGIAAAAEAPRLRIPDIAPGAAGAMSGRVPANVLINLSLTFEDAGAAYRDPYDAAQEYAGYFNPRLCYSYPMRARTGSTEPDLDERTGYFSPVGASDARHACGGPSGGGGAGGAGSTGAANFSGNFMNWATASTLDLLRYGLTGGDRVIDEQGLTVLQRAWLPDGAHHPDFYAHPVHFPRKMVGGDEGATLTPFSGAALYIVSCRNRVLFSNSRDGASCDAPRHGPGGARLASDKYHGEFNARVAVCGALDSASRPDLCRAYGQGFKPEGSVQRAGAVSRIGVMSYLTERGAGDPALYGGVLRAPLKFLGADSIDAPRFAPAPNARAEWQPATGIAVANPDGGPGDVSGAINYINRLGRSNPARPGAYRSSDPGAELYYEALRYLQGRAASESATAPGTGAGTGAETATATSAATLDDGLPVWHTRTDPLIAACQRNVIATIGHSAFVEDRYLPGNTRADRGDKARASDSFAPGAPFDIIEATRRVGQMEADRAGSYGNGAPRAELAGLEARDSGPAGAGSHYLAGAAWWAHTHAVRRAAPGTVPNAPAAPPDGVQNAEPVKVDSSALELGAGSAVGGSALYLAAKYGGFTDLNGDANPFITTGGLRDDSEWRASGAGPAHYHPAATPDAIIGAARALLADTGGRAGLVQGAMAASALHKGKGFLIQTAFDPATWRGLVQRRPLAATSTGELAIGTQVAWDAARLLDGGPGQAAAAPAARKIYTLSYAAGQQSTTIPFSWERLPPALRALLDAPASAGEGGASPGGSGAAGASGGSGGSGAAGAAGPAGDGLGEARTAFLRGERSREYGQAGGVFRRRSSVLGDIIRSVPLLVGPPSVSVQGDGYGAFYQAHAARRGMVYVGANDGMLHGFDSASGDELFAYVPNALLPVVGLLASPDYVHRPFVDASPGGGEAQIAGRWRSVLASGMGMGARGVFALDISDPAAFDSGMGALWEFTDRDDPAMGHVHAPPLVAKVRVSAATERARYRYFVIVASGINNAMQDGGAALFLLALDKPSSEPWQRGVNYYRFATPGPESKLGQEQGQEPGPAQARPQANVLAPPALAIGGDGALKHAYAGDLHGHLWRFDFSGGAPWAGALGAAKAGQPLFIARDAAGKRQPISHAPRIVFAPGGGYLVLVGTGKMLELEDLQRDGFAQQSFYAVHDKLDRREGGALTRAELAPRTLSGTARLAVAAGRAELNGEKPGAGWYADFLQSLSEGERAGGSPYAAAGSLIFDTILPGGDACAPASTRTYVLDALSGFAFGSDGVARSGESTGAQSPGMPGMAPLLLETGGAAGVANATGGARASRTFVILRPQGGVGGPNDKVTVQFQAKRLGWREVANWQDLHEAARK